MITLRGLGFSYPDSAEDDYALHSIDMEIADGSFCAILGANGSGKSTLAGILNALLIPTEGSLSVDNQTEAIDIRCSVGMVFQNPENQIVADTVEQDVAFGPENLGLSTSEIRERVEHALSLLHLENLRKRNPRRLSGGQLQRLAIAGALALQSRYLVLDESLSMLDSQSKAEVLENLRHLNRENKLGIILISHDIRDCLHADHVHVLDHGRIAMQGPASEILERKEELRALGIRC